MQYKVYTNKENRVSEVYTIRGAKVSVNTYEQVHTIPAPSLPTSITINQFNDANNGWAEFINTQLFYNDVNNNNGLALPQGVWVDIPFRDDDGHKHQQTPALEGMINSDTGEIISNQLYGYFLARLDFKVKCPLADRRGEIEFYIPDTQIKFNNVRFDCSEDAASIERPFIPLPFFTGWQEPTRVRMRIRIINGNGTLYGVGIQIKQSYEGKNI